MLLVAQQFTQGKINQFAPGLEACSLEAGRDQFAIQHDVGTYCVGFHGICPRIDIHIFYIIMCIVCRAGFEYKPLFSFLVQFLSKKKCNYSPRGHIEHKEPEPRTSTMQMVQANAPGSCFFFIVCFFKNSSVYSVSPWFAEVTKNYFLRQNASGQQLPQTLEASLNVTAKVDAQRPAATLGQHLEVTTPLRGLGHAETVMLERHCQVVHRIAA